MLESGLTYIEDVSDIKIKSLLLNGHFKAFKDINDIPESEIFLICVPTPLDELKLPDLTILLGAVELVGSALRKGNLVIVESTVEPGSVRELVVPLLEVKSKLSRDDFFVAFSPERIDPGRTDWNFSNIPKLVSGLTNRSLELALDFYSRFIKTTIPCSSLEVAETAKLLENSFRLINISFVNELLILCNTLGIDVTEVINAAATKPYGFMPFYPGLGAGGHCIPVDPVYLAEKAKKVGKPTKLIELATQINLEMPEFFVKLAEKKLKDLVGKKILVIGVAYKANISDVRETPVESLIIGLKNKGAEVYWHDEFVKNWNGTTSEPLSSNFDLAILATPHDYLDLSKLGKVPVIQTRGSI
jgi:UDP-N-acetyl-D-glucosamine dehydrogenase